MHWPSCWRNFCVVPWSQHVIHVKRAEKNPQRAKIFGQEEPCEMCHWVGHGCCLERLRLQDMLVELQPSNDAVKADPWWLEMVVHELHDQITTKTWPNMTKLVHGVLQCFDGHGTWFPQHSKWLQASRERTQFNKDLDWFRMIPHDSVTFLVAGVKSRQSTTKKHLWSLWYSAFWFALLFECPVLWRKALLKTSCDHLHRQRVEREILEVQSGWQGQSWWSRGIGWVGQLEVDSQSEIYQNMHRAESDFVSTLDPSYRGW